MSGGQIGGRRRADGPPPPPGVPHRSGPSRPSRRPRRHCPLSRGGRSARPHSGRRCHPFDPSRVPTEIAPMHTTLASQPTTARRTSPTRRTTPVRRFLGVVARPHSYQEHQLLAPGAPVGDRLVHGACHRLVGCRQHACRRPARHSDAAGDVVRDPRVPQRRAQRCQRAPRSGHPIRSVHVDTTWQPVGPAPLHDL